MGSVLDYIECPNCKLEAMDDFYYKTGEEYVNCGNCGYHYSATIKNREKRLDLLTDKDWKITELKKPYGSYRIKSYDGVGYLGGSLSNKKEFIELKTNCETDTNIETLTVSRFLNGKIKFETVIDNGPKVDGAGFTVEDRELNYKISFVYCSINKKLKNEKIKTNRKGSN
jgi:Zn ribbon nucleic-acid-binding protein